MRRGTSVISLLVAVILGLAVIGLSIMIYQRVIYKEYVPVVSEVVSWKTMGGLAGQAECLTDSTCEGRPGWTMVVQSDTLCPQDRPFACLLATKNRRAYFTPGTLVFSDSTGDHKLLPTSEAKKGLGFIFTPKEKLKLSYVPHTAGDTYADDQCQLIINYAENSVVVGVDHDCYEAGTGLIDRWVLLWKGTGKEFEQKFGARPRGGYPLTMRTTQKGFPTKTTIKKYILNAVKRR